MALLKLQTISFWALITQPAISPKQTDPPGDPQQLLLVQAHRCRVGADPNSPKHKCKAIEIDFKMATQPDYGHSQLALR